MEKRDSDNTMLAGIITMRDVEIEQPREKLAIFEEELTRRGSLDDGSSDGSKRPRIS